jgi:hypothetical protein
MFVGMHSNCKNKFVNDASTLIKVGVKSRRLSLGANCTLCIFVLVS